jgi:hypothetical protein
MGINGTSCTFGVTDMALPTLTLPLARYHTRIEDINPGRMRSDKQDVAQCSEQPSFSFMATLYWHCSNQLYSDCYKN